LTQLLANKDWSVCAFAYIGAGYKKNGYDDKLRNQYRRISTA